MTTAVPGLSDAGTHMPLGLALLLAAVLGGLLVAIPAGKRIIQQRTAARKQAKAAAKNTNQPQTARPRRHHRAASQL